MGAERPIPARFHNPLEEEGLSVPGGGLGDIPTPAEEEEEDDPLTLDHGEEKVDDAGDLLALMTPGRRKFDGELGPERPVPAGSVGTLVPVDGEAGEPVETVGPTKLGLK